MNLVPSLSLISLFATILGGVGVWLLLSFFFNALVDVGAGVVNLFRHRYEPAALRWLKDELSEDKVDEKITRKEIAFRLFDRLFFWLIFGGVLGFLTGDRVLGPTIFAIVLVCGWIFISTNKSNRLARINADTANLIIQFASRFPIKRSITGTLDDIAESLRKGEVKTALDNARSMLHLNRPPREAMTFFRRLPNPTLQQFAVLIADAQETTPEVLEDVMGLLQKDVKSRNSLFGEIRTSLTILRVTTRVLQVILALTMLIGSFVPRWREYFLASNENWLFFLVMVSLGIGGSFYVELESQQLEEA